MTHKHSRTLRAVLLAGAAAFISAAAMAAEDDAPENGTIGYIVTDFEWQVYLTADNKEECAAGLNPWGPREQFKALYPNGGSVKDTHMAFEIAGWFPDAETPDKFPFYEVTGKTSYGLDLDGKTDANDFVSPDGKTAGIDNELYRVIGCIVNLRPPEGATAFYANKAVMEERWNRVLLELTDVDSMTDDDSVDVTMYRGLDNLLTDATGSKYLPGGSMRIDTKWGNKYVQHFKGKIVDGTLITEPVPYTVVPWSSFQLPTEQKFHDMRMQIKLQPDSALGIMAGYVDVENWYWQTVKSESTHHQSYGQSTPSSIYKVLRKRADAYPDPKTGRNTAISASLQAKMVQTFIIHAPGGPVATAPASSSKPATAGQQR